MKLPKWLKKKSFIIPVLAVLVVVVIIVINNTDKTEGEVKGEEIMKVAVLQIAKQDSFTSQVNLRGTIVPREFVRLRSFVPADVQYLAPIGSSVKSGEIVARLADTRVEDNYYNSFQALSDSQNSLQQTQALNSEAVAQAELGVKSAQTALDLAQENYINSQKLSNQDIKGANNNGQVTYESAYNLVEQVLRYWSDGSLVDFVLEDAIVANFELKRMTNEEFDFVVGDFNNLSASPEDNLVISLTEMEKVLERTKKFNDLVYRMLNYTVTGNSLTSAGIELYRSQSVAFTSPLNAQNTAVKSAIIALETIDVTSQVSLDVAKNQLTQAQIQHDNAQAALESAKRQAEIRELGARSQLSGNRTQYAAAQGQFEDLNIKAPFDGVIIAHLVSEGNQISIGESILEMGDISGVEIGLAIDESSGSLLKVGQEVIINGEVSGIIEEVSPAASIDTGKVGFTVVAGGADKLLPGDVAEVTVDLTYDLPGVIIIPLSYVTVAQNENYVLVVEDGQVAKRQVKLAQIRDSQVEVSEGLEEGDKVIITSGEFFDIGQEVEIKN